MHLRVLRVPVVNKVLEFFSSLALQLVGLVMAFEKSDRKVPECERSCYPVHPVPLSRYPVKRGVEKTDQRHDRTKDLHDRGQQLRRLG